MSRTVLEVIRAAAPRLGIDRPDQIFSSTDRTAIELAEMVNDCAVRLGRRHDWQALQIIQTHSGDGATSAYALPSDYWRMPKDAQIWSTRWQRPLVKISSEDWLRLEIRQYDLVTGNWSLFGGNINYKPDLATGEDAKFFYICNKVCANNARTDKKERFTADDDYFCLDDYMLELSLIWAWREQKGMDYAEDMADAQEAIEQAIGKDKGAGILTQSSRRNVRAKVAYPWQIEP